MVDAITGVIQEVRESSIVIDVGPVSLAIAVPTPASFPVGTIVRVLVYMHWNQENGPSFFGFHTSLDRTLFTLIIGCSGIGPKLGLSIIDQLGTHGFIDAVQAGSIETLSSVSGIGPKKAEHILVQLKHKMADLVRAGFAQDGSTGHAAVWRELGQALESLAYTRAEIMQATQLLAAKQPANEAPVFDKLFRQALAILAKQKRS